jgi:internalin A
MTLEEGAYEEALRRIRKAEKTEAVELDLSGLATLNRLPPQLAQVVSLQKLNLSGCERLSDSTPLVRLAGLQTLDLSGCWHLSEFSPLASLAGLQTLDLSDCGHLSDLTPLARLTGLQTLNLSECGHLSDLTPLAGLIGLQTFDLSGCEQLRKLNLPSGLNSLQALDLSGCKQLSELSPPLGLSSLQTLDLHECEGLRKVNLPTELSSLRTLNLTRCDRLTELTLPTGLSSLQKLNLSNCKQLSKSSLPTGMSSLLTLSFRDCEQLSELNLPTGLSSLQTLDLTRCKLLSKLTLPTGLSSLQTLDLSGCKQLSELSLPAKLSSLQELHLDGCLGLRRFGQLEFLLPTLKELRLFGCNPEDLPSEVYAVYQDENVVAKVRAHYDDLKPGKRIDAEVKVLFLGNGGVGKTQLCRRLRGLEYDPSIPTTHGIRLGEMTMSLETFPEPVRLNLWDFGGQDIYHGSHALFLHGNAISLILWTPAMEKQGYQEGKLAFRHRPLAYWLDYLRAFAGTDTSVIIIQSQCDTRDQRILNAPAPMDDFRYRFCTEVSARTGLNLGIFKENMKEAARDCFNRGPPPPIGVGRVKVRDRLRQMLEEDQERQPAKRRHRLLERKAFDRLCAKTKMVSDSSALLEFLHRNGVVFYRPGLFGGRIVLDQNWALEAIYALFDREKILPLLRGYGRFSRADLEALIWSGHTFEEQNVFLGMMEGCGICFQLRRSDGEWEYLAPELLPTWSDAQEQLLGRPRDDAPDAEATACYAFLHEGVLRGYLSKLGEHAKDAAIYWKYGCWFYEQKTRSQVLIESQWDDAASEAGAGDIRFRAWGENAGSLIDPLLEALRKLPVGQTPEIKHIIKGKDAIPSRPTVEPGTSRLENLEISIFHEPSGRGTSAIFVSYAWGDDSSEDAPRRKQIVDRLCETFDKEGWAIIRDKTDMRPGDLISGFMKRIGLSDHVIVVLSDKYLRSPYCMTELHFIYQRALGEKEDFLKRIIPLALADARFGTWRDRVNYARHWRKEFALMKKHLSDLGTVDFALYKAMQDWHNRIGDILAYVSDVLSPQGFDEIVKDDFAILRQMLERRRW